MGEVLDLGFRLCACGTHRVREAFDLRIYPKPLFEMLRDYSRGEPGEPVEVHSRKECRRGGKVFATCHVMVL